MRRFLCFFLAFIYSFHSLGVELWLPATVLFTITGQVTHNFSFPTSANPGNAFEGTSSFGGFFPIPMGNYTKFKRIYALGNDQEDFPENGQFISPNKKNGYNVILKSDYSAGLNINLIANLLTGWMGLGLVAGLSASLGKGYLLNKWVPTFEQAKNIGKINVPTSLNDLKTSWRPGDTISTTISNYTLGVNASLIVMGGVLAAVGVAGNIITTWNVGLEVLSDSKIRLIFAKDRTKKFSFTVGNIIGGADISKLWGKNQSFEYIFDLSNKKTSDLTVESYLKGVKKVNTFSNIDITKAYQEALNGKLIFADMLAGMKDSGVIKVSETSKKEKSKQAGLVLPVPFLFKISKTWGRTFISGRSKLLNDNQLLEELIGIYTNKSETEGIISNDLKRISSFSGNFQQITPLDSLEGSLIRRYSGSYKYYFNQNKVSAKKFEKELKNLRYKIGFMKELKDINLPKEDIGSLEINLDISFSNLATDELMKLSQIYPEEVFVNEVQSYIDGFFKEVEDAKEEICTASKIRLLVECIATTKRQSVAGIKKAYASLKEMIRFRSDMNFNRFVKSYADFGSGFVENRFTLKTILRMLRSNFNPNNIGREKFGEDRLITVMGNKMKVPFEIILSIKGTNLAPYNKVLYTYK